MPDPSVVILAGPNGSGKSTLAPALLRGKLGVREFVNADVIAQGLSGFAPEDSAVAAGRIMLSRMKDLARQKMSFAFETTLASRSFARWLSDLEIDGYQLHLVFLWLPSAEMAVRRVAVRVQAGGHDVPEDAVRRRFNSGLRNFFELYQPLADSWRVYDSSDITTPELVAFGSGKVASTVRREPVWQRIQETYSGGQ